MIILRKCYLELDPEQREYGIKSTAIKAGKSIKKLGKNLKELRENLKDPEKGVLRSKNKSERLGTDIYKLEKEVKPNKKLSRNLARESYRKNIRVFDKNKLLGERKAIYAPKNDLSVDIDEQTRQLHKELLKTEKDRDKRKLYQALSTKKAVVNLSDEFGNRPDVMAHELGHVSGGRGPIGRAVRKLHKKVQKNLENIIKRSKEPKKNDKYLMTLNLGARRILQPAEEKIAWKKGMKLMKKNALDVDYVQPHAMRVLSKW